VSLSKALWGQCLQQIKIEILNPSLTPRKKYEVGKRSCKQEFTIPFVISKYTYLQRLFQVNKMSLILIYFLKNKQLPMFNSKKL
jgi:hypothetical protein